MSKLRNARIGTVNGDSGVTGIQRGEMQSMSSPVQNLTYPLSDIAPDPTQPRRVLPAVARGVLADEYGGVPNRDFFTRWAESLDVNLEAILNQEDYPDSGNSPDVTILVKLAQLAASIRADGLQAPIGIVPAGGQYQIVYGERRWFAFHLLHAMLEDDQWAAIPAREVPAGTLEQATENGQKVNLTAVETARSLAKVLMQVITEATGAAWQPLHAFEHEREYYAQVVGHDIPRGKGGQVRTAVGLDTALKVSRYKAILTLTNEQWDEAVAGDWTEGKIRKLLAKPKDTVPANPKPSDTIKALKSGLSGMSEADLVKALNLVSNEMNKRKRS